MTIIFGILYSNVSAQKQVNISGKWQLSYGTPDGRETVILNIKNSDSVMLASSSIGQFEVSVEEDRLSWSHPLAFKRGNQMANFKGIVKGDDFLKGIFTIQYGIYSGRAVKWKAYRIQSD